MYAIANVKLLDHQISSLELLRSAWLRSPLDLALMFVSEQAIDQLAHDIEADPYEFRLRNIADERWRGVLDAVATASGWTPRRAASEVSADDVARGRGIGLGTHLAGWGGAVAEVEVDRRTGRVRVTRLWGAIDAGLAVNPGVVEAQIEGQLVQTVGRMLYEEVTFDRRGVTSLAWSTYKIARFSDVPQITPIVVQRIDQPSSGAGEEVMAAAAAAIANAFFDATGKRMHEFPFTPERVLAALA
jgi:CO/xanthine dehydrogenase Mo-binding subunit